MRQVAISRDLQEERACRMYRARASISRIVVATGLTPYRIMQAVDKHGISRKGRGNVPRADNVINLRLPKSGYPTSGDPNIIGEHEVPPVCCPHCRKAVPWAIIKGWRN